MFDFIIKESVMCKRRPGIRDSGCNKRIERDEKHNILQIIVNDTNEQQSIQELLDVHFSPYGLPQEDYRCDYQYGGCGKRGYCTKASLLADVSESLVIQLNIFRNDVYGRTWKIFPNISIEEDIITAVSVATLRPFSPAIEFKMVAARVYFL